MSRLKCTLWIILLLLLSLSPCAGQEKKTSEEQKVRDSYSLGYEFGNGLRAQGVEIDGDVLFSAIRDGLDAKEPAIDRPEMQRTVRDLRKRIMVRQEIRFRERSEKNLEDGKAFLKENSVKAGVKTLPSGLQYKVLQEGSGPVPKASDWVAVNYRGTLINGAEFDSSYDRGEPTTLPVAGVIKGWTEALQLMKTGSKWHIFIPPDLAYGKRAFGRIPPNSTLIFEMELLAITEAPAPVASKDISQAPVPEESHRETHSD